MFCQVDGASAMTEIEDFINPDGRAARRDLSRNRPPSVHERMGVNRHWIEPRTSQRDKSSGQFARELNAVLEHGRHERLYQDLIVMAPPRFLGALNAALDKRVRDSVVAQLPKDLTEADMATICDHIPAQFQARPRQSGQNG